MPKKEFRIGIGVWHGQGMYLLASSKTAAYNQAIKSYMAHYDASRTKARQEIKMENIRVWYNADRSLPAWRKKEIARKKRARESKR